MIKKGNCDIYIKKKVFEIYYLIYYLSNFNLKNIINGNYQNDFLLQKQFKEVEKTKLFYLNLIDTISIESIYFGLNYLYNVKVSSRTIAYYTIEVKHLLSIFQDEPIGINNLKKLKF